MPLGSSVLAGLLLLGNMCLTWSNALAGEVILYTFFFVNCFCIAFFRQLLCCSFFQAVRVQKKNTKKTLKKKAIAFKRRVFGGNVHVHHTNTGVCDARHQLRVDCGEATSAPESFRRCVFVLHNAAGKNEAPPPQQRGFDSQFTQVRNHVHGICCWWFAGRE